MQPDDTFCCACKTFMARTQIPDVVRDACVRFVLRSWILLRHKDADVQNVV